MSGSFFILPFDPKAWEFPDDKSEKPTSDLTIDTEAFRAALFEHWGKDHLQEEPNAWILTNARDSETGGLRVSLHDDKQVIALSPGPKHVFLEFVLWYREYVAEGYSLYLTHSSSFNRLQLTADTTADAIAAFGGIVR